MAFLASQQQAILARAAQAVKPGGTLIYAVCSLEPEEGEAVADQFLASHVGFTATPVQIESLPAGLAKSNHAHMLRVPPGALESQGGADGFFVAMFHRKDERPSTSG